jgi:hypothetical protein
MSPVVEAEFSIFVPKRLPAIFFRLSVLRLIRERALSCPVFPAYWQHIEMA